MPLKLTVEVPNDMIADLDRLRALHDESRETFATQAVKFSIVKGVEVEFEDNQMTPEDEDAAEIARLERLLGIEPIPMEEVMRELQGLDQAQGDQGPAQAAE